MLATRLNLLWMLVLVAPAGAEIAIEDPAGDVDVSGLPAGAAGTTYDLREITLRHEHEHLRLLIRLEAAPTAHDSAEFVVVFTANATWMAGYTALPYTSPAPHYRGGFACPATEDGSVNGSQANDCIGIPDWSLEGGTYTVDVPLDFIQASNGTAISDAWGYAELTPYLKGTARVDVTSRGGEMVIVHSLPLNPTQQLPEAAEASAPQTGLVLAGVILLMMGCRWR